MTRYVPWLPCVLVLALAASATAAEPSVLTVDKEKRTVSIECKIAPRMLPDLKDTPPGGYPIEVIATVPRAKPGTIPSGEKAHETVVTFVGVKPSEVHKALESLGLKAGKPAYGEGKVAEGPEVKVYLDVPGADGKPQRMPIEKALVDRKTGKAMPTLKWIFTGSVIDQPDPEKDEKVYMADHSGTLIALFPVTNKTVLQTNLTLKDEPLLKLKTSDTLPKEGTPVRLVIEVPAK